MSARPTIFSDALKAGIGPFIQQRRMPFFSSTVVSVAVEAARRASAMALSRVMGSSLMVDQAFIAVESLERHRNESLSAAFLTCINRGPARRGGSRDGRA